MTFFPCAAQNSSVQLRAAKQGLDSILLVGVTRLYTVLIGTSVPRRIGGMHEKRVMGGDVWPWGGLTRFGVSRGFMSLFYNMLILHMFF